jgi:ssDNA-binding Zn-finger/Zn-ribbon topoisomerase 1
VSEGEKRNQELLPCLKCGGNPHIYRAMYRTVIGCQYFAECEACGEQGPASNYEEEAAFLWNEVNKVAGR